MNSLRFFNTDSAEKIRPVYEQNPVLLSALQSFETALFLFAHHWYPNALLVAVSGIEKSLRAHYKYKEEDYAELRKLLEDLPRDYLSDEPLLSHHKLRELRQLRNRFAHASASPADDGAAMETMLAVVFPFFAHIWKTSFSVSLSDLSPWYRQILHCTALFKEYRNIPDAARLAAFHLQYDIRQGSRHWSLNPQQRDCSRDEWELTSDEEDRALNDRKSRLEKATKGDTVWIKCPFCDSTQPNTMLVHYDHMLAVREKKVKFFECTCCVCEFHIRPEQIHFFNSVADPQDYWDDVYNDAPEDFEWHWQKMREEEEQMD